MINFIKGLLKKNKIVDHKRIDLNENINDFNKEELRILNLLNYTKKSGATYSGELYNSGYHTLNLGGKILNGQRNPFKRFENIQYDFKGKTVLDVGCNQGGMLHACANQISNGVGIDYDSRMINSANKIKSYSKNDHLNFFVFNLENEKLDYIKDFISNDKVDICFLLSVCMWLNNWKEVIDFCKSISDTLLFESNGSDIQQLDQINYLKEIYKNVTLVNEISDDDPLQKKRKLLLCND